MPQNEPRDGATVCFSFTISGVDLSPDELTALSGVEPDRVSYLGVAQDRRPAPRVHVWNIRSAEFPIDLIAYEWETLARRLKFLPGLRDRIPAGTRVVLCILTMGNGFNVHFSVPKALMSFVLANRVDFEIMRAG